MKREKWKVTFALFLVIIMACQKKTEIVQEDKTVNEKEMDSHSFAIPKEAVMTHLHLNVVVDFEAKKISGTAAIDFEANKEAKELILDTKDLDIHKVTLESGLEAKFSMGEEVEHLGQPLIIEITPGTRKVTIEYSTSSTAEALQWLNPSQTGGGKEPFLFTQSQAILARTWIPLQDSPGIRFTYSADVKVPSQLLALMSATNPQEKSENGAYYFEMDQPIPAYLMALSVGDIEFHSLSERTGVYAEPSLLKKAAYEFAELESMVQAAEELYGTYAWERYDIIVLPPSFPFGGMENPRLTFATPTILAGDRSLTSLVAHELAHSWSGNLVTNSTWNDFWLNEGFTVYFEQRIMEALYGRDYSEMLASLSLQGLKEEVKKISNSDHPEDTKLKLNLIGRNPDDGMTAIAYDKGYFFLRSLEEKVGRNIFDDFLKKYFADHAFSVITTEAFVDYLSKELFDANSLELDKNLIQRWVYGTGLPADLPTPISNRFAKVDESVESFMKGVPAKDLLTKNWSSHEWLHFVRALPENLENDNMQELDKAFGFTNSGNSEVLSAWLLLVVKHQYVPAYKSLENFLVSVGRRKFLTPLYGEMAKTEKGKRMAKEIYKKARPNYHSVSFNSIDELLK